MNFLPTFVVHTSIALKYVESKHESFCTKQGFINLML